MRLSKLTPLQAQKAQLIPVKPIQLHLNYTNVRQEGVGMLFWLEKDV